MDKEQKLKIATFRFGIIADFVNGAQLAYGEREKLLRQKGSKSYAIPFSDRKKITRSSIKKWIKDYIDGGQRIEALFPKDRIDSGNPRSLDSGLQMAIKEIVELKPKISGKNIITELKHRKIINTDDNIGKSVFYRFLKTIPRKTGADLEKDARCFEATYPNEMWQADVLHGPKVRGEDGKLVKAYLIGIIDDHSRLIPHAGFYLSEKIEDFKNCLKKAIEKRGLPRKLYIDNGSCFVALNVEQVAACLGIAIKHTPPYTPQGRGKIERWFRTVRDGLLSNLENHLTLPQLNELLDNWIENYHNRVHSSTGQAPLIRFHSNLSCIRHAPPNLLDYFRYCEFRRIKKDRTFRLNGMIFEGPVALIDKQVEIRFHKENPEEIEIFFENRSYGEGVPLNKHVNFKIGRNNKVGQDQKLPLPTSGKLF